MCVDDQLSRQKKSQSMQNLNRDVVSRIEYDEKEQECLSKDEEIQVSSALMDSPTLTTSCSLFVKLFKILRAKVRRLEHLLQLKDIRISELSGKAERTGDSTGANNGTLNRYQRIQAPANRRN